LEKADNARLTLLTTALLVFFLRAASPVAAQSGNLLSEDTEEQTRSDKKYDVQFSVRRYLR
jgi:hypothetical protein